MDEEVKISGLPNDTSIDASHYFPLNDPTGPTTKRTTIQTLLDFVNGNISSTAIETILAALGTSQNMLINGGTTIWQRNTSASPNDDVYTGCDRWNMLTETNGAWTVAQDTDVPTTGGSKYSIKCSNVTLNNQMGLVQFLEAKDAAKLFGKNVSLSFMAKTNGTEIANLRIALLSWTSTEDVVTSDVIGTWAQNGTNPTWATNWTMENTPVNLPLTSSWTRFTAENIAIDTASTKNIAVVIWVDDGTIAAGDDFYLTQIQLNIGTKATQFIPRNIGEEHMRCSRYYQNHAGPAYRIYHSNVHRFGAPLPYEMRASPTTTKSLSGSGIQSDNTAGTAKAIQFDTQFTGGGAGVIDATWVTLNFSAEL